MDRFWSSFQLLVGSGGSSIGITDDDHVDDGPATAAVETPETESLEKTSSDFLCQDLLTSGSNSLLRMAEETNKEDAVAVASIGADSPGGWDIKGQLLGAGARMWSPISSSHRIVKNFLWGVGSGADSATRTELSTNGADGDVLCFGVNIPLESRTKETAPGVYFSRVDVLKMVKKCPGARFKEFKSVKEAEIFAALTEDDLLNASLLLKTPSKPRNPVFIDSPPPPSPPRLQPQQQTALQQQQQQQIKLKLLQQQQQTLMNGPAGNAERLPFKAPKPQELNAMRRYISSGNMEALRTLIWSNPRYLISSGDTPTIVQPGFHYTAMHVAARIGKHEIVEMLIATLSDDRFMRILYDSEPEQVVKSRQKFLLDLYINLPDKGANDTPLHLACKYGHAEVIRVLLRHPLTSRNEVNKYKETPAQVIWSRCPQADSEDADSARLEIEALFESLYVVPIFRPDNGIGVPKILSPALLSTVSTSLSHSKSNSHHSNYTLCAYAGPMSQNRAADFRQRLSRPVRPPGRSIVASISSTDSMSPSAAATFASATPLPSGTKIRPSLSTPPSIHSSLGTVNGLYCNQSSSPRVVDSEKGLEHEARQLASEMGVAWRERWEFLGPELIDFGRAEDLNKMEEFFAQTYRAAAETNLDEAESSPPLEDSFADDDSLGDLIHSFRSQLVIMSPSKDEAGVGGPAGDAPPLVEENIFLSGTNEHRSPETLQELCRMANPFGNVEGDIKPFRSSTTPFEVLFFVKGDLPSNIDAELFHALDAAGVDDSTFPHLAKWRRCLRYRHSEEERRKWPSTPGLTKPKRGTNLGAGEVSDFFPYQTGLRPLTLAFETTPTIPRRKNSLSKKTMDSCRSRLYDELTVDSNDSADCVNSCNSDTVFTSER